MSNFSILERSIFSHRDFSVQPIDLLLSGNIFDAGPSVSMSDFNL